MSPDAPAPRRAFALIPAAILVLATLNLNVPYFSLEPGPVREVAPLIRIEGREAEPEGAGAFLLTTVSLRELKVADAIRGWVLPDVDLVRRSVIIPPGVTEKEVEEFNTEQMEQSQVFAAVAALDLLGYQLDLSGTGVEVRSVRSGVPASEVLRPGDIILGAGGQRLCSVPELVRRVVQGEVGQSIDLRVLREGKEVEFSVRTVPDPGDPERPIIGVEISPAQGPITLPVGVDILSQGIGGPSAGLMFALGIFDELEEADLTGGRTIAGTGVISCAGEVDAVGGLRQKLAAAQDAGAQIFLVPSDELEAACEESVDLQVIGVTDLGEAVRALQDDGAALQRSCAPIREAAG